MTSYVLTGGTGFIGSHVVNELLKKNFSIYLLIRKQSNISRLEKVKDKIIFFKVDEIETIFKKNCIDGVIHLATSYGRKNETLSDIINTNLNLPIKLLEISKKYGVKYFLNTDTFYESKMGFKDNLQFYTLTKEHLKMYADKFCAISNINFINIKLFHVYGNNDDKSKFIPQMVSMMLSSSSNLAFSSGIQHRDFVHVLDISKAYLLIIKHCETAKNIYKYFELGSGDSQSIKSIIKKTHELSNSKQILSFNKLDNINSQPSKTKADLKNISSLGWNPKVTLEEGLKMLINSEANNKN